MARFITVNVQCDWALCEAIAAEGDGIVVPKTLSIDGKQGREFLLCKSHLDDFERIVLPLMAAGVKVENGKKSSAAPSTPAGASAVDGDKPTLTCRVCDRDDFKNNAGLSQHVIKAHGFENLGAYKLVHPDS
jgi:hypothetical protein